MRPTIHHVWLSPSLIAGAVALTACGGGSSDSVGTADASGADTTVAVRHVGSGDVLTDGSGHTLYVSDQEHRSVLCRSSACTAIWHPLTIDPSQHPTGPARVSADLSTLKRPDGSSQVAFDGKPLYAFSFDHGAGEVNGDGQADSFDGTDFTWHTATATGGASAPASPNNPGGGYRY